MRININLVIVGALLLTIILATLGVEWRGQSPIDQQMQQLADQIKTEDWSTATSTLNGLETAWNKRRFWLALNNSVQDQQTFERTLAQVKAYVHLQDRNSAAGQAALLRQVWREFGE